MVENVLIEKEVIPDQNLIERKLLENSVHLESIRNFILNSFGETNEEWKHYGEKIGWLLKKFYKKRNLFFITICEGYFNITFVFGQKAFDIIEDSKISSELKTELAGARKYAEGRGLNIKVESAHYLKDIEKLIVIKIEN